MRFKGLDLNLLVAFDALMATRSVSRSAERLNLSQPAMSAALSRLPEYFGDELLQLQGQPMHPTPLVPKHTGACRPRKKSNIRRWTDCTQEMKVNVI